MSTNTGFLTGKKLLITGVLSNRSIAIDRLDSTPVISSFLPVRNPVFVLMSMLQ